MEAVVVGVERNNEDSGAKKSSSSLSTPMTVADPVVYKLVRVKGDGRFVPATDDKVMEVEDFLVEEQTENVYVEKTADCILHEESVVEDIHLEDSKEGLSCLDNTEADAEKLTSQVEEKEIVPSSELRVDVSSNSLSANTVEFPKPLEGQPESVSSTSSGCNNSKPSSVSDADTSKPDFSMLKGEICFEKLSTRELHQLFKATFGRETTVKDKRWLKRRITMGLTNSCDIPITKFTIKDNILVNKGDKESRDDENGVLSRGSPVEEKNVISKNSPTNHNIQLDDSPIVSGQVEDHLTVSGKRLNNNAEFDLGSEDMNSEQRAAKRVRKPTKRYIEELSETEPRDSNQKEQHSDKNIGLGQSSPAFCIRPVRNVSLNERTVLTRLDSLGGSGVQIPCVSRVRRSRPRKNIKSLMKFHQSSAGMAARVMKKALALPKRDTDCTNSVSKSRHTSKQTEPPLTSKAEKGKQSSAIITVEMGKNPGLKQTDSSDDASDDNTTTIPTAKGGMRRKHHRAWSIVEVMKLVEGVSKCGAGRWSEIKRLAFASYSYRTSVDLKDKWRNLLKASLAKTPPDEGVNSRKHATSVPIPAAILLRVRELAEMHSHSPPDPGSNGPTGVGGRSSHEVRSGYL